MRLPDGTIIPSNLGVSNKGSQDFSGAILNDYVLRLGEVKKVIRPDDKASYSKAFIEYDIDVQHQEDSGIYVTTLFRGAFVQNTFGGGADFFTATLRPDPSRTGGESEVWGVGSKVLCLCLSGNQQRAVILGGYPDASKKDLIPDNPGHHLAFEFNGFKADVNDDGEAKFLFRGKTKHDGELADSANPDAEGTYAEFNKEGNFTVSTVDEAQFFKIDHENKKIEVLADEEWRVSVNGKLIFGVGDTIEVTGDSTATLTTADNVFIRSSGVHVGDATDAWMLGTTYRNDESTMNNQIYSQIDSIASALQEAGQQLASAAAANATPVTGGGIAAPSFAAAAAAISKMVPLFRAFGAAIKTFESAAPRHLSKKNLTD